RPANGWPEQRALDTLEISGTIVGLPDTRGHRVRFELKTDAASRSLGAPRRVLLTWYRPRAWFQTGERWQLTVQLQPLRGRLNPGGFDYQRYLLSRSLGATGRVLAAERLSSARWPYRPLQFRQRFADWAQANTDSLDAAALMRALTVGDRSAMDSTLSDHLRRTGTAHLLAISGLHVGMVAGLVGLLFGWLLTPIQRWFGIGERQRIVLLTGLLAAALYALLAGFSLPTQRALVMLIVGFGALLLRRSIAPGHALLAALTAVLLLDPMAPLATGFWLSFCAVSVLIWSFAWRPDRPGWWWGLLRAQLVMTVGLLALNVGVFQQLIPIALLANLLAIPLVGFWILPALLVSMLMFACGFSPHWPLAVAEFGLVYLTDLLAWLSSLPWSYWARPAPSTMAMVLAFIGGMWLIAPRRWPARGVGLVLFLPLLFPPTESLQDAEFDVWLLDVGTNSVAVIRTADETVLFDAGGGDGQRFSDYSNSIEPFLRSKGVGEVDRVIVSNHMRSQAGGLFAVLESNPDVQLYRSDDGPGQPCWAGRHWTINQVRFEFHHPSPGLPYLGADSSCVLEIRSVNGSMLLTSRIGPAVVNRLLNEQRIAPVDAWVMPRMGHRDAFSSAWFDALSPQWSLVSTAAFNASSLPHREVEQYVQQRTGQSIVSTANCGAIQFRVRVEQTPQVRAWAEQQRRFWLVQRRCSP
ncbi:MAG: DNA internalization-related competence protein ComEC/Rec2, partial [Pseudomonadota bacterium]